MPRPQNPHENLLAVRELSYIDGPFQSPIDINFNAICRLELPPLVWNKSDVIPTKMKVTNTGHTVMVSGKWKCERPYLSGGPLKGNYVFSQIHFHWGPTDCKGSEHTVNGESFPLEMHVNHFKTEYQTQELALREQDGMVVIVYLFKLQDEPNPNLRKLLNAMPCIQKPNTSQRIDPRSILAFCNPFTEDYFMYWGSSVTKTCAHVLLWLICREPFGISTDQLCEFRKMLDLTNRPIRRNNRDTHPLHKRHVIHVNASKNLDQAMLPIKNITGCYCSKKGGFGTKKEVALGGNCSCQIEGDIEDDKKGRNKGNRNGLRGPNTIFVQHVTIHSNPSLHKNPAPVCVRKNNVHRRALESQSCCFLLSKDSKDNVNGSKEKVKRRTKRRKRSFDSLTALTNIIDSLEALKHETYRKLREIEDINKDIKGMKLLCSDMKEKRWLRKAGKVLSRQKRFTIRSSQLCFNSLSKLAKDCDLSKMVSEKDKQLEPTPPKDVFWFGKNKKSDDESEKNSISSSKETTHQLQKAKALLTLNNHEKFSRKAQKLIHNFLEDISGKDEARKNLRQSLEEKKQSQFAIQSVNKSTEVTDLPRLKISQALPEPPNDELICAAEPSTDTTRFTEQDVEVKKPIVGKTEQKTRQKKSLTKFTEVALMKPSIDIVNEEIIPLRRSKVQYSLRVDSEDVRDRFYNFPINYKPVGSSDSEASHLMHQYNLSNLHSRTTVIHEQEKEKVPFASKQEQAYFSSEDQNTDDSTPGDRRKKFPKERQSRKDIWENQGGVCVKNWEDIANNIREDVEKVDSTTFSSERNFGRQSRIRKKVMQPKWNRLTKMRHQFIKDKLKVQDSGKESPESPERKKMKIEKFEKMEQPGPSNEGSDRESSSQSVKVIDFDEKNFEPNWQGHRIHSKHTIRRGNPFCKRAFPTDLNLEQPYADNKMFLRTTFCQPAKQTNFCYTCHSSNHSSKSSSEKSASLPSNLRKKSSSRDSSTEKKKVMFADYANVCTLTYPYLETKVWAFRDSAIRKSQHHMNPVPDDHRVEMESRSATRRPPIANQLWANSSDCAMNNQHNRKRSHAEKLYCFSGQNKRHSESQPKTDQQCETQKKSVAEKIPDVCPNISHYGHSKNRYSNSLSNMHEPSITEVNRKNFHDHRRVHHHHTSPHSGGNSGQESDPNKKLDTVVSSRMYFYYLSEEEKLKIITKHVARFIEERFFPTLGKKPPVSPNLEKKSDESIKCVKSVKPKMVSEGGTQTEKIPDRPNNFVKLNKMMAGRYQKRRPSSDGKKMEEPIAKSPSRESSPNSSRLGTPTTKPPSPKEVATPKARTATNNRDSSKSTTRPAVNLGKNKPHQTETKGVRGNANSPKGKIGPKSSPTAKTRKNMFPTYLVTSFSPTPAEVVEDQKREMNRYLIHTDVDGYFCEAKDQKPCEPKRKESLISAGDLNVNELEYLFKLDRRIHEELATNVENSMNYVQSLLNQDYDGSAIIEKPPVKDSLNIFDYASNGIVFIEMNDNLKSPNSKSSSVSDDACERLNQTPKKKKEKEDLKINVKELKEISPANKSYKSDSSCDCEVSITVNSSKYFEDLDKADNSTARNSNDVSKILKKYIYHLGRGEESNIDLLNHHTKTDSTAKLPNKEPRKRKRKNRKYDLSRDMKQKLLAMLEEMRGETGKESSLSDTSSNHSLAADQESVPENYRNSEIESNYEKDEMETKISELVHKFLNNYNLKKQGTRSNEQLNESTSKLTKKSSQPP